MNGPDQSLFDVEEMEINFGPQHPATHGVLRVKMKLDGEKIIEAKPIIGYLHRGTEKLFETMTFPQCIPHTDRMDYVAAATNNQGFCVAMEKLLGITIPPRAAYIRMILAELQRLASHLVWLATHAVDIGAITPFFYTFRERDAILDLFEEYCGARLTLNTMKIGGVPCELPEGWLDRCSELRRRLQRAHRRVRKPADREPDLEEAHHRRRRGHGRGSHRVGSDRPAAARVGCQWDIRKVFPYDRYDEIDFDIPIGENGDTYDRYLVRMEEMRQSVRIIRQCLDKLPDGPVHGQGAEDPPHQGRGHGLRRGGGPQGRARLLHRRHTQGHESLSLPRAAAVLRQPADAAPDGGGALVADLMAVIGTLDIVLGEIDR